MQRRHQTAVRVLVTGEPYFVRPLQRQLPTRSLHAVYLPDLKRASRWYRALRLGWELCRADVWYQVQGCAGRGWSCELALRLGVPVILHWLGTDVTDAVRYFRAHPDHVALLHRMTHWVVSPWLQDELAALGVQAQFVPFPQEKVARYLQQLPPPLPDRFSIITYIRDQRPAFYGWEKVLSLARHWPDIPVRVLGTEGCFAVDVPANVRFLGWQEDPYLFLCDSTVLVRMTEHDGYSGMVLEALALGRHVVWTYALPGVLQACDEAALFDHIASLHAAHQAGILALNSAGRAYMETHLRPQDAVMRIVEGVHSLAR